MIDRTGTQVKGQYQGRKFCGYVTASRESKIWRDTQHTVELESWIEISNVTVQSLNLTEAELRIIQSR